MALPININQLISGKAVEWDRLEFKKGWNPEEIIHTLCAFSNDINNWGGGYIVVGIEEKEGIPMLPPCGLSQNNLDMIQKELVNLCHQVEPLPQVISEPVEFQDKHVLIIWAPGGNDRPYKAPTTLGEKGQKRYFIRRGSVSKIANSVEEKQLLSQSETIPFDDRINYNAELSDLSPLLVKAFLNEVKSDLALEADKISFEDLCRQVQIVGGTKEMIRPKNVGLLCFSNNPEKFFPYARIEIVHFLDDIGDRFVERIFSGSLFEQLKAALLYFKNQVIKEMVIKVPEQAEAIRFFNYPYEAIEEALVNAAYHKSYNVREPIEIRINYDSIQILSFEGPMPPISNVDLKKERIISRSYRNRRVGDFLKELDYTEGRSTGFPKIHRHLKKNYSPEPQFETDENNLHFLATIYCHKLFAPKPMEINEKESLILDFCRQPKSSREILDFIGVSYHSKNMANYISSLIEAGFLYYTNPESTKHSNQKYITVEDKKVSGVVSG
ncbi:MAG: putative DNA binding domain-containing protein [Prevotellaceae bacterium]|jgi:ATP-dependent DNA helicase RecG|nr:putative DNA binding domain-containing protein [Prevotellaceae bacterium]